MSMGIKKGEILPGPSLKQYAMIFFQRRQPSKPCTDDNTNAFGVFFRHIETGIIHSYLRRGKGILDKKVDPFYLLVRHILFRD